MLYDGGDVVGEVAERVTLETSRMRGKHRRGQDASLVAARREYRQRHRQRALTNAGYVLNS